ncbi:MAG: DUF5683 domain-containing protein [Balneolaceae bacterium]|nr:DUF5683 domain-containing protein [Balneolaceae bacterium]
MAEKFASNITLTKIWTDYLNFLNRYKALIIFLLFLPVSVASAQSAKQLLSPQYNNTKGSESVSASQFKNHFLQPDTTVQSTGEEDSEFPNPQSVLYKSLMIPGWGQLVNKQAWKIPLVYGLIGGVAAYSVFLTKRYRDYRAAYYNATHDDMIFGPTPDYIPENASQEALRNTRNRLRNRRDFSYLGIILAYGLNGVDAYVFAHMRSFDVSEDLSMKADVRPALLADATPGITVSISLSN